MRRTLCLSNLHVVGFRAENVQYYPSLLTSCRTVTSEDLLSQADALICCDKLVQYIFAKVDAVFVDSFILPMPSLDVPIEHRNSVSQTGAADGNGFWIDAVENGAFENS